MSIIREEKEIHQDTLRKCDYCHGLIVYRPISDFQHIVECEDCGEVYKEE